ncbi:hypothetical protein ACFLYR_03665 [Chloroflexota bacterium]
MATVAEGKVTRAQRSKDSKTWRRLRQAVQILALLLFLYLMLGTRQDGTTILPHDLFFRLDPLAGIAAMVAGLGAPSGATSCISGRSRTLPERMKYFLQRVDFR